jgi:CheY-like chemotaxis protein
MNEKILLVEDEEANLGQLTQWLVLPSYDIAYAPTGEEALRSQGCPVQPWPLSGMRDKSA